MNFAINLSLAKQTVSGQNAAINNSRYANLTRTTFPQRNSLSDAISWSAISLALCALGCATNSLVLYATWPKKTDKSGVNLQILHFIIANLLFCLIHCPAKSVMVLLTEFRVLIPIIVCDVFQNFNTMNWYVLFWADAFLALNRCVALFLPHSYQAFSSTRNNIIQIAFMWLSALAMSVPGYNVMIPSGHCAWRTVMGSPFSVISLVYRNAPVALTGAAALLILGKCYWLARTGYAAGRVRDRVGTDGAAGPNPVRQRVRLALALVAMYIFSLLTNQSIQFLIFMWPKLFEIYPAANLWMQITLIVQYAFASCFFLVGNPKHWDKARVLLCGCLRLDGSRDMRRPTLSSKIDVVNSEPKTSQPPATHTE